MVLNYAQLSQADRQGIWEGLAQRQYYALVGSGASFDSEGRDGPLKMAGALKTHLCNIVGIAGSKSLQQAYSLLDKIQVNFEITDAYTTLRSGLTIQTIVNNPWKRVYTLNVDNAFEVYLRQELQERLISEERFQINNYLDDYSDPAIDSLQSIVHLHGTVERPEEGYVFTYTEYAKTMSRTSSWMSTLSQLMKAEPFIVAGTTLEEIDVVFYLEQRRAAMSHFVSDLPSILIEPFPDRITEKLCEDHDFILFHGTTLDFFAALHAEFTTPVTIFSPRDAPFSLPLGLSERDKIQFYETFEKVPVNVAANGSSARFLLGSELTWGMLSGNVDIRRDILVDTDRKISALVKDKTRFFVILDDPGTGKSALLRRLAFRTAQRELNTFYFRGREHIDEESAARIFGKMNGRIYIFVDNVADSVAYLSGLFQESRAEIVVVCAERKYRRRYVEDALADVDVALIDSQLDLSRSEARQLILLHTKVGLADMQTGTESAIAKATASVKGEPISIASCRIQKNFFAFDTIVRNVITDCVTDEIRLYATVGLARYCYSGGVSKSILAEVTAGVPSSRIGDLYARLPVIYSHGSKEYVIPSRTAVAERAIEVLKKTQKKLILQCLIDLANALAPRVNREQIRLRTPEAKLAGGLLDFDRSIQKFANDSAEEFYDAIYDGWNWNARYWEQLCLLKLDRYFMSKNDSKLLQEAIQNARFAFSKERHPLSLTTLAKALFSAIEAGMGDRDTVFEEAWDMILQSIDIEKRWDRLRSTAFIVCFRGVLNFVRVGGMLTGTQADGLRDVVAITHSRKLRDRRMSELREEVVRAAF